MRRGTSVETTTLHYRKDMPPKTTCGQCGATVTHVVYTIETRVEVELEVGQAWGDRRANPDRLRSVRAEPCKCSVTYEELPA